MIKKGKRDSSSVTEKTYLGLRLLFVILWPALVTLFVHSNLSLNLTARLDSSNSNLLINSTLLVPIALIVFPVAYQMDSVYGINRKKGATPTWKHIAFGVAGTSILLGIAWYLFIAISFALTY